MSDRLTDSDWQRIERFANTPNYLRSPEMLVPETETEERDTDS